MTRKKSSSGLRAKGINIEVPGPWEAKLIIEDLWRTNQPSNVICWYHLKYGDVRLRFGEFAEGKKGQRWVSGPRDKQFIFGEWKRVGRWYLPGARDEGKPDMQLALRQTLEEFLGMKDPPQPKD